MVNILNSAALELQFARKFYAFRAPESAEILRGVCSHINIDLRLFFELLLWNIDVYSLGASLSIGVCDKLIRAVSVRRQLAEQLQNTPTPSRVLFFACQRSNF